MTDGLEFYETVESKPERQSLSEITSVRNELVYFRLVKVVHGIYSKLNKELLKAGLTAPQFEVISLLARIKDVKLKDIGELLLITGGNVTGIMDRLEKMGYVERIRDVSDRRVIKARLVKKGFAIFKKADIHYRNTLDGVICSLNKKEKRIISGLLKRIERKLNLV